MGMCDKLQETMSFYISFFADASSGCFVVLFFWLCYGISCWISCIQSTETIHGSVRDINQQKLECDIKLLGWAMAVRTELCHSGVTLHPEPINLCSVANVETRHDVLSIFLFNMFGGTKLFFLNSSGVYIGYHMDKKIYSVSITCIYIYIYLCICIDQIVCI